MLCVAKYQFVTWWLGTTSLVNVTKLEACLQTALLCYGLFLATLDIVPMLHIIKRDVNDDHGYKNKTQVVINRNDPATNGKQIKLSPSNAETILVDFLIPKIFCGPFWQI